MIKKATLEEIEVLYENYFKNDFPDDELKPLKMIKDFQENNRGETIMYYANGELVGYASVLFANNYLFLDYFATISAKRKHGYGTNFLKELSTYYQAYEAIFLEAEAANTEEAHKRLNFYQNAGCVISDVKCSCYYVDYYIVTLSEKHINNIREKAEEIYHNIYDQKFCDTYIKFY